MQRLHDHDRARAVELLGQAFDADPFFNWMMRSEAERRSWIRIYMAMSMALLLPDQSVYGVEDDGQLAGVIGICEPGTFPPPNARILRLLYDRRGLRLRLPSVRLLKHGLSCLQHMDRLHPRERHYYVMVVGVSPRLHGRGFGRKLLGPICARADEDRLPAYLETGNEKNLGLYRHFGFEVRDEIRLSPDAAPLWTMWREPRPVHTV